MFPDGGDSHHELRSDLERTALREHKTQHLVLFTDLTHPRTAATLHALLFLFFCSGCGLSVIPRAGLLFCT